jgi:hypothetical protein
MMMMMKERIDHNAEIDQSSDCCDVGSPAATVCSSTTIDQLPESIDLAAGTIHRHVLLIDGESKKTKWLRGFIAVRN